MLVPFSVCFSSGDFRVDHNFYFHFRNKQAIQSILNAKKHKHACFSGDRNLHVKMGYVLRLLVYIFVLPSENYGSYLSAFVDVELIMTFN